MKRHVWLLAASVGLCGCVTRTERYVEVGSADIAGEVPGLERSLVETPTGGFVSDGRTAFRIAEAVLLAVFGEESLRDEYPLRVGLIDGERWLVCGTFSGPDGSTGSSPCAEIARSDGRVLRVGRPE